MWDDSRNDESQLGLTYKQIEEAMDDINSPYFEKYMGRKMQSFKIQNQELWDYGIETENIKCNRNDY